MAATTAPTVVTVTVAATQRLRVSMLTYFLRF
jgi:hypothetical protein